MNQWYLPLQALQQVELCVDLPLRIQEHFDLCVGTSSGKKFSMITKQQEPETPSLIFGSVPNQFDIRFSRTSDLLVWKGSTVFGLAMIHGGAMIHVNTPAMTHIPRYYAG
ncbi:hypothetical protein BGX38DRAFT_1334585 [Terfezia claveryi]|nr:hypothetical protein BGX38DRAFT_1334585 [Terfezia claveryi]